MDLTTKYLGLDLKHPVVASAGPLSSTFDGIKRLEDSGASAIVMFSLFEEQIRHENAATEHLIGVGAESFPEALDYFPAVEDYEVGPEPYLELIRRAQEKGIAVRGIMTRAAEPFGTPLSGASVPDEAREMLDVFPRGSMACTVKACGPGSGKSSTLVVPSNGVKAPPSSRYE